jgi:hypothetical protein
MKPPYVVPALWAAFAVAILPAQQPPQSPAGVAQGLLATVAPDTWSTKTYRFPSDDLGTGFVSRDKGQLRAPKLPKANATEAEVADFLKKSDAIVSLYLKDQGIPLPEGSVVAYDSANQTLVIRTSGKAHEQIGTWATTLVNRVATTLTFATYLIEAEASEVRKIVNEAGGKGDHSAQLARLKALVGEGKGRQVDLLRLETRSGQRATVVHGEERVHGVELKGSKSGWTAHANDTREIGARMELDPVLGPDGETLDLNISIDHDYRLPLDRWEPVAQTGSGLRADVRVTDFYRVKVTTAQTMMSGTARLLGVWKPEGAQELGRENRLLVAIVRADVVPLLASVDRRLETIFAAQAEKLRPTPAVVPGLVQDPSLPPGMIIRRFKVVPSFLSAGASRDSSGPAAAAAADPFAAGPMSNEPRMTVRITALDILRAQGIVFPQGSSANFNSATSELIVRNTSENMALVEAFIDTLTSVLPINVSFDVQIVQADGAFLRKLEEEYASRADHGKMWQSVEEAIAQGRASYVQTLWTGTRSGQRVVTRVSREYSYVTEASTGKGQAPEKPSESKTTPPTPPTADARNSEGELSSVIEMRPVGTSLELDPVIGPDGRTIDVNYALDRDYAAPTLRVPLSSDDPKVMKLDAPATSFHRARLTTSITYLPGMIRLIGIWKPEGAPNAEGADVMQAAFMRANLDPVGPADK